MQTQAVTLIYDVNYAMTKRMCSLKTIEKVESKFSKVGQAEARYLIGN